MKLFRYLACGLLIAGSLTVFTACDDDKDLGEAPRLFSPVVTTSTSSNSLVCKWHGIKGATAYLLTLERALPAANEDGSVAVQEVSTVTIEVDPTGATMFSPYTFENLDWDERYRVSIKALGTDKESKIYTTEFTTLSYPTKLKVVNTTIDTGARIEWNEDQNSADWVDIAYMNVFIRNDDGTVTPWIRKKNEETEEPVATSRAEESQKNPIVAPEPNDEYYYSLTEEDIKESFALIRDLEPSTNYRVVAYNKNGEYRGRRDFKTLASEVFDNPDLVFDLRLEDTETIESDFIKDLPEGAIVLLKGGVTYSCTGTPEITNSLTIRTGMSLSGKALIKTGGFVITEGTVGDIVFKDVKIETSADKTSSNFGGKYLINQNKLAKVNSITLDNIELRYMRGGIRIQSKPTEFDNVIINNCVFDSIGGYRVLCIDNAGGQFTNVKITNTTFANCEGVLRNNKEEKGFDFVNISDCTFAFCGTEGAQIFDFNSKAENNKDLQFNAERCIFGPGYGSKEGALAKFQGFRCGGANAVCAFAYCYLTADAEYLDKEGVVQGEIPGAERSTVKTADLWVNPFVGDFTIKTPTADCADYGDPRWRVAK